MVNNPPTGKRNSVAALCVNLHLNAGGDNADYHYERSRRINGCVAVPVARSAAGLQRLHHGTAPRHSGGMHSHKWSSALHGITSLALLRGSQAEPEAQCGSSSVTA